MQTYVALLRGINVGGHKKVPMTELRELLNQCGFENVSTYIQTGNVLFQSLENNTSILEMKIHNAIKSHFGFDVSIIVITRQQLQSIFDASPFPKKIKEKSYFIILDKIPDPKLLEEAEKITYQNETFKIIKNCLYFHSAAGYGNSKFNMNLIERKLKVIGTARNYNTMLKLLSLTAEL